MLLTGVGKYLWGDNIEDVRCHRIKKIKKQSVEKVTRDCDIIDDYNKELDSPPNLMCLRCHKVQIFVWMSSAKL